MSDFEQFYNDLKYTEKKDAHLTSEQQIARILRPGSAYLNLNPFEVLQVFFLRFFKIRLFFVSIFLRLFKNLAK
jgi:hypothetical protein